MPFVLRITSNSEYHQVQKNNETERIENSKGIVTDIFKAYSSGNREKAFQLIFINNLKSAIINIFGGISLGVGTFANLAINGFYSADVFCTVHKNGMSWSKIIEYTAPHSFEMIGIWLSGGLGFYIAILLIKVMVKNKYPKSIDFKIILVGTYTGAY